MKVLVSGGAGYIGCCVIEELVKRGHEVSVFDTFYWGKEPLVPFLQDVKLIEGDCRNSKDVIYALDGFDSIIHLAGIVGAQACEKNQKAHFSVNVESTRTLINCCTDPELNLVRDFLFASSCSVYGNVAGLYSEVTEDTPTNPLSAYAYAKLRSEQIIMERSREIPHFHPTILRLTTVFGWSARPRLDLVTNLFAYKAWRDGELTIHGDGCQYRSLIHVRDVATAFVDTLEAPRFMRDGKVFHVGEESNNKTVKEIAEIVKANLPETEIKFLKGHDTDRRDYRINCQRLKNVIGWKAQYTVSDGIKELIARLESLRLDWESEKYRNGTYDYI
jgi:nucleoside-diphosphate-sugar epimerase